MVSEDHPYISSYSRGMSWKPTWEVHQPCSSREQATDHTQKEGAHPVLPPLSLPPCGKKAPPAPVWPQTISTGGYFQGIMDLLNTGNPKNKEIIYFTGRTRSGKQESWALAHLCCVALRISVDFCGHHLQHKQSLGKKIDNPPTFLRCNHILHWQK